MFQRFMSSLSDMMSSCTVSQGDLEKCNQVLTDIQMELNVAAQHNVVDTYNQYRSLKSNLSTVISKFMTPDKIYFLSTYVLEVQT